MRIVFLVLGFLFFISCEATEETAFIEEEIPKVLVIDVQEMEISDPIVFAGTLEPSQKISLYGKASGLVQEVYSSFGESLKKNQKIMLIDPQKVGFQPFILHSPMEGILLDLYVKPGEFIELNQKLGVVAQLKQFEVSVQASTQDLFFLKIGTKVKLFFEGMDPSLEGKFYGKVDAISPLADRDLGTFKVKVKVVCEGGYEKNLRAGTFLEVTLSTKVRKGIKVPSLYLRKDGTQAVLLSKEEKATWVPIETGEVYGDSVEITKGLKAGDRLITSFSRPPKDGEKVIVSKL